MIKYFKNIVFIILHYFQQKNYIIAIKLEMMKLQNINDALIELKKRY